VKVLKDTIINNRPQSTIVGLEKFTRVLLEENTKPTKLIKMAKKITET